MKKIYGLFLFSLLLVGAVAEALPWGYPVFPTTRITYDCVPGPGYLRYTIVDDYGTHLSRNFYVGTDKEYCKAQVALLRKTRSVVMRPSVIALCSAKPVYQAKFQLDGYENVQSLPYQYLEDPKECLASMEAVLSVPSVFP